MRILMISKALVVGAYHKKISEMAALGMKIDLLIPTTWGNQRPEITNASEYAIHRLPISFSGKNHFHFYHGLSSLVDSISPDILHIDEEPYSLVTYQTMRIAKRLKIKSLFFTWQNINKRYPYPFSSIERHNYKNANIAIAGNQEAKCSLQKKGFTKDIFVIPQFGVDTSVFLKQNVSSVKGNIFHSTDTKVIGYIGRLVEEKGIMILLDVFSKLDRNFNLLLIGDGPLKQQILKAGKQYGIADRLTIISHVPSKEIPMYMNCIDCLILPSLTKSNWKEQFGRVLIEAMSCEVPVIGSDSGEIPNVIGDAGLLFKEGNSVDLREKIGKIFCNQRFREEMGRRGRERVENNFTQKHIAAQTLGVYQKLQQGLND